MSPSDPQQRQTISNSTIENSQIASTQAGRDAVSYQNSHGNTTIIYNSVLGLFPPRIEPKIDWDWAYRILPTELAEIRGRLRDSLIAQQQIGLAVVGQLQHVGRPPLAAQRTLRIANQSPENLEPQKLITEVFGRDDIQGKLLILGAPGAGKTMMLLSWLNS